MLTYRNYQFEIEPDCSPENPRDWDNLSTIICFHKRYALGDSHDLTSDQFSSWDDLFKYIVDAYDPPVICPVYLYDHSGLRIKIGSFDGLLPQGHAEFDSGQVGFIFVPRKKIYDEYSVRRVSSKIIKRVIDVLHSEISVYDQYLSGDVWSYCIYKDGDIADSLSGLYGYNYAVFEAERAIDNIISSSRRLHFKKLKSWIKNRVPINNRYALVN